MGPRIVFFSLTFSEVLAFNHKWLKLDFIYHQIHTAVACGVLEIFEFQAVTPITFTQLEPVDIRMIGFHREVRCCEKSTVSMNCYFKPLKAQRSPKLVITSLPKKICQFLYTALPKTAHNLAGEVCL